MARAGTGSAAERVGADASPEQERVGDEPQRPRVDVACTARDQRVELRIQRRIFTLRPEFDRLAGDRQLRAAAADRDHAVGRVDRDLPLLDGAVPPVEFGVDGHAVRIGAIEFGRDRHLRVARHVQRRLA